MKNEKEKKDEEEEKKNKNKENKKKKKKKKEEEEEEEAAWSQEVTGDEQEVSSPRLGSPDERRLVLGAWPVRHAGGAQTSRFP